MMNTMARGWESKSVEAQQEESAQKTAQSHPRISVAEASRRREKEGLLLSRQRVIKQLESVRDPAHRHMLEQALAALNEKLSRFN